MAARTHTGTFEADATFVAGPDGLFSLYTSLPDVRELHLKVSTVDSDLHVLHNASVTVILL